MSYSSRVYRQRNAHTNDDTVKEPFFSQKSHTEKQSRAGFFQAKLSINKPGDQYEQEADSVANAVVNRPAQSKAPLVQQKKISTIQRLSTPVEEEKLGTNDARMAKDKEIQEKPIQRMTGDPEKEKPEGIQKIDEPEKEKPEGVQKMDEPGREEEDKAGAPVQKKGEAGGTTASPRISSQIENASGKGNPLSPKTQHEMSSSFGLDFSSVRIHNDSEAVSLNKELRAQAFTRGNDIFFNAGKFNPESAEGKLLLAHELTHVVQQNQHQALQKKGDPRAEAEAKYAILIQVGDKDWAPSELDMLYTALKSLSKDEATVLRKYRFVRWESKASRAEKDPEYKNIKSDECGLHEADLKNGVYKISMYDACFADPQAVSQKTAGIDNGQFHILHEIGHAMQQAELRNKTEDSHEKNSKFNQAVEAYNAANAKAQGKMKPGVDKLDAVDAAAAEAMKKSEGRSLKDLEQLIEGKKPLTDYSEKNSKEAFAEAFAIYKADPAGFKEINPVLSDWFSSGGYLKPPVKK